MPELLDTLVASFRRELGAENRSPKTIRAYTQGTTSFRRHLAARSLPDTDESVTRDYVRDWLVELGTTVETGTVRTYWRGMHRFCKWLVAEDILDAHPMDGLSMPALTVKPVPVLTDDQLTALLKACAGKRYYDRRDEAVIRLLLDCGPRVAEVCSLRVEDVDLEREMALVTGKGRKVRPVYFSVRTARALDRYLRMRRAHRWAHLDAFFLGERGALTPDGVRELVRVRSEAAGIGHVNPHKFRHTFAHDFLINGGQERDLKRLAGWSSDVMLERYGASAADVRAQAAARRMSRGDRV